MCASLLPYHRVKRCSKSTKKSLRGKQKSKLVDPTQPKRYSFPEDSLVIRVGFKDAEELKRIYKENNKPKPQTASSSFPPPPPPPEPQVQFRTNSTETSPTPPPKILSQFGKPNIKTLSSFLDVPKVRSLPSKEISSLWRLRHASDPNSLCASIPVNVYRKIETTARRHPQFILPLAREIPNTESNPQSQPSADQQPKTAAEIHFLQWTFPAPDVVTVLFTHLAEYKVRGEYAQPHTTVSHHLDLADDKGLVLLQGQVVPNRGVSVDEGRWLLMCLQKFYGMEEKEERRRLLKMFSEGDTGFRVEELVSEAEKIL